MTLKALVPTPVSAHPYPDDLEEYVFGRMSIADQARIEQHVLVCASCCERLEETFIYIETLKRALYDTELGTPSGKAPNAAWRGGHGRSTASEG
jgi:hypothetical protein